VASTRSTALCSLTPAPVGAGSGSV